MKLLLDENISFRVLNSISTVFPGSAHVAKEQTQVRRDAEIFDYARQNEFTILTFDEDFYELQLMHGYPPKIIWLRFGNSSNLKVISKLLDNQTSIISFISNPDSGILEIY